MKKVSILALESSVIQAIADPQYCFSAVNQFLIQSGKKALFDIQIVGLSKDVSLNSGIYSVHTDKIITQKFRTDLIIIPALFGDMEKAIELNKPFLKWINQKYSEGAEIASLCVGAFLLASTGLVDGKKCSTHWNFSDQLKTLFPNVEVQHGKIVTEENRIYSSGGATSYWNLLLHLVEKYTDRETAILTAKYFAIDIDRSSQSVFSLFKGQKIHNDVAVKSAQDYIENNIEEKISIDDLADKVSMGRRSLERRFKQITHNSIMEYIQRVKIEAAKRSFESTSKNINEVMYGVGYTDTKAFRSTFKKVTGLTPMEYRNKYQKLVH